ncbi:DUF4197 domain-containing protein [Taibaiella helva]|uniref:DUF4197 domain-containing protein n=1 Tax=Taibaiella helva TaxID=2301235 RepID=UPI001E4F7B1F|nr:DUF4197 domain-containing protein [Taibaiella helva]
MKKLIAPLCFTALLGMTMPAARAQSLEDIFNAVKGSGNSSQQNQNSNNRNSNTGSNSMLGSGLSNTDIASGLKEALKIGAQNAGSRLSATDGFFKNAMIKILLPKEAQQVEKTLRSIGMGSVVDKAILSMNRAAEDAAKQAAPIFINAITSITIQDGLNILRGGNNAATNFLKTKTTSALTAAFTPVIQKSLNKVGAPDIWKTVFSTYNRVSPNKVNPDLTGYVTERALNGLFVTIGDEEAKIRTNPASQVTGLLQKVFGKQ